MNSIAEIIKIARENQGLTQEQLAEQLDISRQAVSKWEMGTSVPSPENLQLLEQILKVSFPKEGQPPVQPRNNPWKPIALVLAALLTALALFVIHTTQAKRPASDSGPSVPTISGVYFLDPKGQLLMLDKGDGWNQLDPKNPVFLLIRFQEYGGGVNAVALYFTPSGTETLDQRKQLAVQQAGEGRDFALFPLELPQDAMGHLDVVLECSKGISVTETRNVIVIQP